MIVDPELDGAETLGVALLNLLNSRCGLLDLTGRCVEADGAWRTAEHLADWSVREFSPDIPECGLDPPVAPTEVRDLAQTLLHQGDVTRVFAEKIWTEEITEARPLAPNGGAGAVTLDAIVGGDPDQRESIFV